MLESRSLISPRDLSRILQAGSANEAAVSAQLPCHDAKWSSAMPEIEARTCWQGDAARLQIGQQASGDARRCNRTFHFEKKMQSA
ncbi:MAG TPA: hypothetical protein VGE12_10335 [Noviherbaspirillum sp.]